MNIFHPQDNSDKIKDLKEKVNIKIDHVSDDLEKKIVRVEEKIYNDRKKIAEMDKKIWQIQKSTKTLFKIFSKPHNWLRSKSKTYYNWHLSPYADGTHWAVMVITLILAIFLSGWQLGLFGGTRPASMAAAGIPKMINYQGKLTDLNNIPKSDGNYNMKFSIYDALTGGSRLWTCAGTLGTPTAVSVAVANGIFSVLLGSGGDCSNALNLDFNTDAYYLGVTVGADSEMADRKRIGAVGYAYNSDTVDGRHETEFALLAGRSGGQSLIGGSGTTDDLILQSTSGVGASGSDIILKVGNNGATEAMRILYDGKVGIGTTSPTTPLTVSALTSGTNQPILYLRQSTASDYGYQFNVDNTSTGALYLRRIEAGVDTGYVMYLAPTGYTQIFGNGNIAVDTWYYLASFSTGSPYRGISLGYDTSGQIGVIAANSGGATSSIAFRTFDSNWNERMRLAGSKLGIGVTDPTNRLEIRDTGVNSQLKLSTGAGTTNGGWMTNFGDGGITMHSGVEVVSSNWIARSANAIIQNLTGGQAYWYANSGLTPGSGFAPTVRMTLTVGGNLGIGTSSPTSPLSVTAGAIDSYKRVANFFDTSATAIPYITVGKQEVEAADTSAVFGYDAVNNVAFLGVNGDAVGTPLHIKRGGNVGIGVTNPTAKFQIINQGFSQATNILGSLTGTVVQSQTTNARSLLTIVPNGTNTLSDFLLFNSSDYTTNTSYLHLGYEGTALAWTIGTVKSGSATLRPLIIDATGVSSELRNQMTLATTGKVGIGDTSPDTLLDLLATDAANTQITITNTNAGDYDTQIGLQLAEGTNTFTLGVDDSDSDKFKISTTALGTSDRFVIDGSGQITMPEVYNTTVGVTNRDLYIDDTGLIGYVSSSVKYKKNITEMADVGWLYDLRPVNFTYKSDSTNKTKYGLVAEEVEQINPDFVSYNKNGNPETVSYSALITPMLKAIQDQKLEIKAMRFKIDYLTVIDGAVNINKLAVKESAVLEGKLTIKGEIVFNKDTIGQAKIKAGDSEVQVTFEKQYEYTPIVSITQVTNLSDKTEIDAIMDVESIVKDVSAKGFKIYIKPIQFKDIVFNWNTFGSNEAKIFVSDGTSSDLNIINP